MEKSYSSAVRKSRRVIIVAAFALTLAAVMLGAGMLFDSDPNPTVMRHILSDYFSQEVEAEAYSWNQKLTIEVVTQEEIRTGSSIVNITWNKNQFRINDASWLPEIVGQAPYVELADGRNAFALLGTGRFHDLAAMWLFDDAVTARPLEEMLQAASEITGEPLRISNEFFPNVVAFADPEDPTSIAPIQAGEDDIIAVYFYVEAVEDEVTQISMRQLLPWLNLSRDELLKIGGGINPVRYASGQLFVSISDNDLFREVE